MNLDGGTALVTGGGSGVGLVIAKTLAAKCVVYEGKKHGFDEFLGLDGSTKTLSA